MDFNFNRLSSLLFVFFLHGFVYACLFIRRGIKLESPSDKWLGLFLFLCVLYISPYMLGFAGWYNGNQCLPCRNILFYVPFQHTLLIGPVVFFYLQSLLNPNYKFKKRDGLHFLPAGLYIGWTITVAIVDRVILKRYYLMDGENDPDFDTWYVILGLISFLYYLLRSISYYRNYRRFIVQEFSFADTIQFTWVGNFLKACFIYFLATLLINVLFFLNTEIKYSQTWWYYMFFGVLFYYIAITGYSHSIERKKNVELAFLRFRMPGLLQTPQEITEDILHEEIEQQQTDHVINETYDELKEKILDLVVGESLFRDPELTLTDLARKLGINSAALSKIINNGFRMNFNDFINYYRVQEVKKQLQDPANSSLTIMSLAYDASFNSKATFNRAFKKHTGENPSKYQMIHSEKTIN